MEDPRFVYPLSRDGFRYWTMQLHSPVVVVGATEEAQRDLDWASEVAAGAGRHFSFTDLLQPFGTLKDFSSGSVCANSEGTGSPTFHCPTHVTVRLNDQKRKSLDVFPVRFIDQDTVAPRSSIELNEKLICAVSDRPPPTVALQLRHRLYPFSVRRPHTSPPQPTSARDVEPGNNSQEQCAVEEPESESRPSRFSARRWIASYPHSVIRQTDTYRKSQPQTPTVASHCTDEFTAYDTWLLQLLSDSSLVTCGDRVPYVWWEAWIKEVCSSLDRHSDSETLCTPLAFIYFASSREVDPVSSIEKLGRSLSSITAGFPEVTAGRCYVLLDRHTATAGQSSFSHTAFNALREAYPPSSCHLIALEVTTVPDGLLDQNAAAFQTLATTVILQAVIPTLERLLKRLTDQMSQQRRGLRNQLRNLWTRRPRAIGTGISTAFTDTALDHTADMLWGTLSGGPGNGAAATQERRRDSKTSVAQSTESLGLELVGRLLGDVNFFLGEYTQAASAYRGAAADFRHLKSAKQQGRALEMLGICLMLSGAGRSEIESAFNQASASYYESSSPYLALRAQVACARALICLDPILFAGDAAEKLDRLSYDMALHEPAPPPPPDPSSPADAERTEHARKVLVRANSLRSALLLEQAGLCYSLAKQKFSRKMQFYFVLAGHTFSRSGLKAHALRCYSIALRDLGDYRWRYVSDHLLFSLARQSFTLRLLADSLLFFLHLLNNLVIQAVPYDTGFNVPFYSRSTAFTDAQFGPHYLPIDSQSPRKITVLATPPGSSAPTVSREATYIKEALFVFKAWSNQVEAALAKDGARDSPFLQAFQRLRFELTLPCVHNDYRVHLGSDPEPSECADVCVSDGDVGKDFNIVLSQEERDELMYLQQQLKCTVSVSHRLTHDSSSATQRTAGLGETIYLDITMMNPLQIPLECHNLRPYCTLDTNAVTASASTLLTRNVPGPFFYDPSASVLVYKPQSLRLEANQTVTVKCPIFPKKPGLLRIHGICWDLYDVIKVYAPLDCGGARRPTRQMLSMVSQDQVPGKIFLPGEIPSTDPAFPLLEGTLLETPLSLPQHPLPPAAVLKRALLVAQFVSSAPHQTQRALRYAPRRTSTLKISSSCARVSLRWNNWPHELLHGQRRTALLCIKNIGPTDVTTLRIRATPQAFCFFQTGSAATLSSEDDTKAFSDPAPPSTVFYHPNVLKVDQELVLSVFLRGASVGSHNIVFWVAAETAPSPFSDLRRLSETSRKWFLQKKSLAVHKALDINVKHRSSVSRPGGSLAVLQVTNDLPHEFLASTNKEEAGASVLAIDCVECLLSGTTHHVPLEPCFYPVAERRCQSSTCIPYNIPVQLLYAITSPVGQHNSANSACDSPPSLSRTAGSSSSRLSQDASLLAMYLASCRCAEVATKEQQAVDPTPVTTSTPAVDNHSIVVSPLNNRQTPTLDFVVYWRYSYKDNAGFITGEQFLHNVPLTSTTMDSLPIRYHICLPSQYLSPPDDVFQKTNQLLYLNPSHRFQRVSFVLRNLSLQDSFRITVDLNAKAFVRESGAFTDDSSDFFYNTFLELTDATGQHCQTRIDQELGRYMSEIDTSEMLPKDQLLFLQSLLRSRITQNRVFYLGTTQFSIPVLKPGETYTKVVSLVLPRPGIFNVDTSLVCAHRLEPQTALPKSSTLPSHAGVVANSCTLVFYAPSEILSDNRELNDGVKRNV